jgi:hypothetical protein
MTKHGDFCLSPENLMLALLVLLLAVPAFVVWGWFAPATPIVGDLILAAILGLAFAYPAKIVLKHVGEAGTLWTRVAGCLTSAMIAFGHLGLAWAVGNGIRHGVVELLGLGLPMGSFVLLLEHLFNVLDFIPEDEEEKNGERVGR